MAKYYEFPCGCRWPLAEDEKDTPPGVLPLLDINVDNAPSDCPATWELLGRGETKGVFQLESPLGRQWTKKLKPENYEHLAALASILRPGALRAVDKDGVSMTQHYVRRKNLLEEVTPYHPVVDDVLKASYGCNIFQETSMALAVAIAGFTEQEADMLRKAAGKKMPEEMAKCKKMFIDGAAKTKVVSTAQAEEIFSWIEKSQRYSFNRCISARTLIKRGSKGKHLATDGYSVEEMYRISNDLKYAKTTGHLSLYRKWKMIKCYGKGYSLCQDGRIRPNIIKDIQPSGKKLVYCVTVEGGRTIDVTDNHKFPTSVGELTLSEIIPRISEIKLYVCGEYEKTDNSKYKFSDFTNNDRKIAVGKSGTGTFGTENRWYTNGSYSDFAKNDAIIPKVCNRCGATNKRLELDHKSGDRTDSSFENLERLCASCHKKKEYACGRTKRGEKGYPSIAVSIVSIEPLEEVETYDVTMEGPNHNFVVSSGIVTCNSHAACYGVVGYRTAYLKAHAPIAFFTAWLLNARHKQDPLQEVYELVNDAKLFDIDVQPPDLRSLEPHFHTDRRVIKFGLTDVKGIGPSQMKMLPDAVKEVETFLQKKIGDWNWWEFLVHFSNKVSAATITKFAKVGALRWLSKSRRLTEEEFKVWSQLTANEQKWVQEHSQEFSELTPALRALAKPKKEGGGAANKNRISIIQSHAILLENPATPTIDTPLSMAYDEEDLLGIAITCSQVDACDLSQVNCSCKEFFAGRTGFMLLGVQVEQSKELKTKTGKSPGSKYLRLMIGDGTCSLEAVAWSEVNKEYGRLLTEGNSVIVQVERDYKDKESKCATIKKVWQAVQTV